MINYKGLKLALTVVFALHAVCFDGIGAIRFPAKWRDTSPQTVELRGNMQNDLMALVRPSTIQRSEIYTEALSLLTSMQAAPSCNRLAASALLAGCQTIDGSAANSESSIEQAKSIYAAQLALCELLSAGSAIPHQCKSLEPTKAKARDPGPGGFANAARGQTSSGQVNVTPSQLSQCLQALESRPQWWTSYSNSRQNAVVMCKAAREDIAKDELIKLHQSIVHTNTEAHSALSSAVQQTYEDLARQSEFAKAVDSFQKQLLRDLESSSVESQSYFSKAVKSMEHFTQSIVDRMTNAAKTVEDDIAVLDERIHKSKDDVIDLQKNVGRVFQQAVAGGAELASSQAQHWQLNQDLANNLQQSLEKLKVVEMQGLVGALGVMHDEIRMSHNLVSQLYLRQSSLDERFAYHDQLLTSLNRNAEAIHATQTKHAESHALLVDQMQTEIHVARGLLADITTSAASLQASVEYTSTKIANMAALSGVTASFLRWGWLSLVVFVIYLLNPRYAGYLAAGLGTILLLWASGVPSPFASLPPDTMLIHYASGYEVPLIPTLKVAALLLVFVTVSLAYGLSPRFSAIHDRTLGITSGLPFTHRANDSLDAGRSFNI